jgi:DNA-binding MarR family transcriptional regulator
MRDIMRKIKLTPLQNSILWMLEEAGEETTGTIRATLCTQGNDEEAITTAIETLTRLNFVSRKASSVILTTSGRAALTR